MNSVSDAFFEWATDSSRTQEERFGVLVLIETLYHCHYREPDRVDVSYDKQRAMQEARKYNAIYRPMIEEKLLRFTVNLAPTLKELSINTWGDDRPVRDIGFLQFMPALETLNISHIEVEDLEPIRHCKALRSAAIDCAVLENCNALADCVELRSIQLTTKHPWPDISEWERLPHLERLTWGTPDLGNA